MKIFYFVFLGLFFGGCAISEIEYNSPVDPLKSQVQEVFYEKCSYSFGGIGNSSSVEQAVREAVFDANSKGYYGNELINVKVIESGGTGILFSKYCLEVRGNLIFKE